MLSRKAVSTAALVVGSALAAAQFIPAKRTDAAAEGALEAPPGVEATLRRACFDCHSDSTRWPWYSRVAPLSWLIIREVNRGRKEVNFSRWGSYYPATRRRKLQWIGRALRERDMPPRFYRVMHPGARLTSTDVAAMQLWISSAPDAPSPERSKP